ncbi:MAG: hypothetical protein VYC11_05700 [Candidatus Thermoplasmatota archaeon]|nr:hypothetical protein [Candidatus Thermoplasmatota archaeon]MEC9090843.1 hypothetical protein [Candidatus Thermoplasmatota archaeon]MED5486538.1 hypothetical protein [Candidatus Thermoplasmatota archaeon]
MALFEGSWKRMIDDGLLILNNWCPMMSNTLLVLIAVTAIVLLLFWRELLAARRASTIKGVIKQKRGFIRRVTDHDKILQDDSTLQDVDAKFEADRKKKKGSLIRDMANQNPWKDGGPGVDVAREMVSEIELVDDAHMGKRTIPSKDIDRVDRSDRIGEDLELSDWVSANVAVQDEPAVLKDVLADVHVARRKEKREQLSAAVDSVDELLDE